MTYTLKPQLDRWLKEIEEGGLTKQERIITSPQQAMIDVAGQKVLNLCANNYLGLSNHPEIVRAAREGLEKWGYGLSSVRFICGTQAVHKELEARLSSFLGQEDTLLYGSCFDANGGLFEALLGEEDAVISDALNHASIIDGIRLCKAKRFRYRNGDLNELETCLKEAAGCRFRLIATDGVFSMDGISARLPEITELADRYGALLMVDESHATGVLGQTGRGTHEHCGVMDRIDIITGTLGKALGGATGGFTSGRREIIAWLRQRSRPYLFSNSLAPSVACASIKALDLLATSTVLVEKLRHNCDHFRSRLLAHGFQINPQTHAIIPIMIGDADKAQRMAARLLEMGIYVIGFSYPVVPRGAARIRTQVSAAHSIAELDLAVAAFAQLKSEFDL